MFNNKAYDLSLNITMHIQHIVQCTYIYFIENELGQKCNLVQVRKLYCMALYYNTPRADRHVIQNIYLIRVKYSFGRSEYLISNRHLVTRGKSCKDYTQCI